MSDATDLAECSALQLLYLYRRRKASPVEATRAVLARIDRLNPVLNAFCVVAPEGALRSAAESEARWARREPAGDLDGVPVSIKDLILAKGWPTLRGSRTTDPKQAWDVDAPASARLREAGAVILGKTTTPEFGCKGETNSPLTGITRNPWNPQKTSGGSSGGTAAAIASGMGPLSVGTDGAGSVRIPAGFCGNFGLKPSLGRVPPYDYRDYLQRLDDGVRGLRIAFSPTLGYAKNVHPEIAAAVAAAVREMEGLGAYVEAVDPGIADPLEITTGLWFAGAAAIWSGLTTEQQKVVDPDFRAEAELGAHYSALDIHRLNLRRGELGSHLRQFMQRFDLIATPTLAVPAFDARPAGHSPMNPEAMLAWTPFSYPFNLSQQPACTIPCGLTTEGLPIGLQLVGPMFGDALVLRAARAYETVRPIARPTLRLAAA